MIRWAVPALAVAAVGAATIAPRAVAEPALPAKTAEQLLVDLQQHDIDHLSGTVETVSDLGLPAMPGEGGSDAMSLLTGSNTVRVWQSGHEQSRVSLLGNGSETTIVRNGDEVWQWSSESKTAKRSVLPDHSEHADANHKHSDKAPNTPQEAAQTVLSHIEPTTTVSVSQTARVAGRSAYELVLDPDSPTTLVAKVAIAVDSETNTPLRVEVWPNNADDPAVRVGFTQVSFDAPDASIFAFTPPSGATVEEAEPRSGERKHAKPDAATIEEAKANMPKPVVVGEGWDKVTVVTMPEMSEEAKDAHAAKTDRAEDEQAAESMNEWKAMMESLPTVQGDWGSGKVLTSSLFTVVMSDDGRIAAGMVPTDDVVAALR